jgi:fatty acid desaturase
MDDHDFEAVSARIPGWKALITGPRFPVLLHTKALQLARPRIRRWILAEFAAMAAMPLLAWGITDWQWLQYHVVAMVVGQCFSAFFAVWTVHHDCDRSHFIARTLRNDVKSFVSYNMFYHVEHHLFPAVPTCRLPRLAQRLDEVAPELRSKQVF